MPARKAKATWLGDLKSGNGQMSFGGRFEQPFSFATRFENANGSNPDNYDVTTLTGVNTARVIQLTARIRW